MCSKAGAGAQGGCKSAGVAAPRTRQPTPTFSTQPLAEKSWQSCELSGCKCTSFICRYEEPGADRIMTHPRVIEGAVRKPDDRRKRSRESKKARQEAAEAEAREELKRLKNLKKGEIAEK